MRSLVIEVPNVTHAWVSCLSRLTRFGHRVDSRLGGMRELIGAHIVIRDPQQYVLTSPQRKFSPGYAFGELLWYLSGSDEVDTFIARYAPKYKELVKESHAFGAYGARIESGQQLLSVANILANSSTSRQAVISIWDTHDVSCAAFGQEDIPCTLSLQFLIRDGQLHVITTMRSNDVWLGMPYDLFCFCAIQCLLAKYLNVEVGTYTHNVGSLHLYDKHVEKAYTVMNACDDTGDPFKVEPTAIEYVPNWTHNTMTFDKSEVSFVIEKEAFMRLHGVMPGLDELTPFSFSRTALQCCALHLGVTSELDQKVDTTIQKWTLDTRLKIRNPTPTKEELP